MKRLILWKDLDAHCFLPGITAAAEMTTPVAIEGIMRISEATDSQSGPLARSKRSYRDRLVRSERSYRDRFVRSTRSYRDRLVRMRIDGK